MLVFKHMVNESPERGPQELAELFKLFGVEARVRIVELLKGRTLCVGALAARLGVSSAAVSQHLRILRAAGLVEREKRGVYAHYRLDSERLEECRRAMADLLSAPEGTEGGCVGTKPHSDEGSTEDV
ncbi:MAG: metalloregulator ArsR/SmtB family transcription factor [Candidatus Brocadiia bacterium]